MERAAADYGSAGGYPKDMTSGDDQRDHQRGRRDRPEWPDPHDPPDPLAPRGPYGAPAAHTAHHPHDPLLTPDLPPAAEAPELPGAVRTRPEDSPVGRQAELPPPYGTPASGDTPPKGA